MLEAVAAVICAASRLEELAKEEPELEDSVATLTRDVRELQKHADRQQSGPVRIVCVGRTKAGKSTLRYVLTGEGEDGIGRGAQRTTKECVTYTWQGASVVDTPGVGAHTGDVDV